MRRFMVHLVTEVGFVGGDDTTDGFVPGYEISLAQALQDAAQTLSSRVIGSNRVETVLVAEIKGSGIKV